MSWLRWSTEPGRIYQIFYSQDLQDWRRVGVPILGESPDSYFHNVETLLNGPSGFFYLEVE